MRRKKRRYVIILEKGKESFGAYVPDLPGCVAVGETKADVTKRIKEAIEFYLEGLQEEGMIIPDPQSSSRYVEV